MSPVEFYDISLINCIFEKIDLGPSDFDIRKLKTVAFSQSILYPILETTVKITSAESKK